MHHPMIVGRSLTTDEWMSTINFLTRTGQTCTPLRQEFILLSDVLGVSALVDSLNNPPIGNATESSVLGPFFTEDAPDGSFFDLTYLSPTRLNPTTVPLGESIASEGKGEYMYVEGRVLTSKGEPIPGAVIETWETDEKGEQHLDVVLPLSNDIPSYVSTWLPTLQASTILNTWNAPYRIVVVG
jgi:protocatechuate 3,4-dioxygenase beta subunit